jgi:hypothetical protein
MTCEQCGQFDLMILVTKFNICGSCTRKNQKKATGK